MITFSGKGPEGGTNYSFSVSSTYNTQRFSHPSFTGTSGSLGNGVSSQTAVYSFSIPAVGGFAPNGNILAANDAVNGNWAYTYDSFNRLSSAVSSNKGLGCGWLYDRYGNRWQQNPYTGTCGQDQRTYTMNGANTNNNRMDAASYDALGNLLVNPSGGGSYVYDAESRLISAGGLKYIYDAEGRRVAKLSGSTVTNEYLFDTDGSQQIELSGSGAVLHTNLYAGGKLIATYQGTNTYFHFTDWLGTRRYETNSAGAMTETCTNLPFGDSQSCTGTPDATEQHFTGKEHDTESGLDYFGARYYANVLGRFNSPDPALLMMAKVADPQQWNMYSYVRNNPLRLVDANGKWPTDIHNRIIDSAFPGLSKEQRSTLKSSSYRMDHCATCQMKSHNHEHFMKSPGEDAGRAKQAALDFIHTRESAAQKDQGGTPKNASDISTKSLSDFGQALHTVTDGTSPAHVDANGNPRDWNGIPGTPAGYKAVQQHDSEEATISSQQMDAAVQAARDAFGQTFGSQALHDATTPPPAQNKDTGAQPGIGSERRP